MEKGSGSRHQPSSSKSSSSDSKNKPDASLKYSRFTRYKDGASPRPDTRRKPNPQKNREAFDKRPRTRSGAVSERYGDKVADGLDVGQFPRQGSKKVNLNHLLNFTLAPVDGKDFGSRPPIRNRLKLPKYNKELFLQANCQFVTRDDGNYARHCQNPDVLVDWTLIEEVRLPSYDIASCPICLYTPVAAKITRCGHIYCWPCILHYLALTDRSWQKCPICFEAVHKTDLKSVLPIAQKQVMVGDEITMCLMKREKGSMVPVPVAFQDVSVCKVSDDQAITRFQKLLLASKSEVVNIINREQMQLREQLMMEKDAPEACFIETALKFLHERENSLEVVDNSESVSGGYVIQQNTNLARLQDVAFKNGNSCHTFDHTTSDNMPHSFPEDDGPKILDSEKPADNNNGEDQMLDTVKQRKDAYYFYQAEDGQHIYLHNLNVRMCVKEFGLLEASPSVIKAKVVELENLSMTEALRKRLRCLQHLPLTCEFQVAELSFEHVLSKATIQEFKGEILRRQKFRNRKAKEERKREKHIEEVENRKLGKFPGATYNLNSVDDFPTGLTRGYLDNREFGYMSSSPGNDSYDVEYPSVGIANLSLDMDPAESSSPPATSFAQMLHQEQISFSEEAFRARNAIEAKAVCSVQTKELSDDDDEHVTVPEYRQSFIDAFQVALDTAIKKSDGNEAVSKKKKRGKTKVLFTTSMCRSK